MENLKGPWRDLDMVPEKTVTRDDLVRLLGDGYRSVVEAARFPVVIHLSVLDTGTFSLTREYGPFEDGASSMMIVDYRPAAGPLTVYRYLGMDGDRIVWLYLTEPPNDPYVWRASGDVYSSPKEHD